MVEGHRMNKPCQAEAWGAQASRRTRQCEGAVLAQISTPKGSWDSE